MAMLSQDTTQYLGGEDKRIYHGPRVSGQGGAQCVGGGGGGGQDQPGDGVVGYSTIYLSTILH